MPSTIIVLLLMSWDISSFDDGALFSVFYLLSLAIHQIGRNAIVPVVRVVVVETAVRVHIPHVVRVAGIRRAKPPVPRCAVAVHTPYFYLNLALSAMIHFVICVCNFDTCAVHVS